MSAYLIANYDVTDEAAYQTYMSAVGPTIAGHGGEILVAGAEGEAVEGNPGAVTVVVRFPSLEALKGWYGSEAYQAILPLRRNNSAGAMVFAPAFTG